MRKLVLRMIAVLICAIFIYSFIIVSLFQLGKVNALPNIKYTLGGKGHTLLRLQEVKKVKNVDILFVGSSHAYRGFDPRIFKHHGIESFNIGSPSQTPLNSYFLLKEHLTHIRPRYLVLELYWNALAVDGVESGADIISNTEISSNMIKMICEVDNFITYNSLLISSGHQLFKPLDTTYQKHDKNERYIKGGFSESLRKKNKRSSKYFKSLPSYEIKLNSTQLEYIEKILLMCLEHNIQPILVVAPVTKEYKASIVNYDEYKEEINKIAKKFGKSIYDYNQRRELILSTSIDFYDISHLNQSGVDKFNKLLIRDLQKYESL